MIVRHIELDYFRNYLHLEADFDPRVNVVFGDNAQGKTNLLEAVAYLSCARSHRARYDRELISFGIDSAFLKAEVFSRERDFTLEAQLHRGSRRSLFSNGVKLRSAAELSGILRTVLFCPGDLYLIKESPGERRKFLDSAISQMRPKYAAALAEYEKLCEQKTRILKDWEEKPSLLDTLEDFNLRMAQTGALLIHYRAYFVEKLKQFAPAIHAEVSGGREKLELRYETVGTVEDPLGPTKEIFKALLAHQESHRDAELASRTCLSGPHRDDLEVTVNGISARTYGSQGQIRTAALALKLAEREILCEDCGEYPVLLLDDVLSELDPRRQEYVLNRISGGQVFITCCEDDRLQGLEAGRAFRIREGKIAAPQG